MFKNIKAFSLVELMVTLVIAGITSIITVKMFGTHIQATRTIEAKYELIAVTNIIKEVLSNASSCTKTLGGRKANSTIYTGSLTAVPPDGVNTIYGVIKNSINFQTLYISNTSPNSANTYNRLIKFTGFGIESGAVGASSIGYTNFKMRIQIAGASLGSKVIERKIKIKVRTDADSRILTCGDFSSLDKKEMARLFCLSIGGRFNFNAREGKGSCRDLRPYGNFIITNSGTPSISSINQSDSKIAQLLKYMCETFRGAWSPSLSRCSSLKVKGIVTINSSAFPSETGSIQIINQQGVDLD